MKERNELYELLPAIYRMRDAQLGGPIRVLLDVLDRDNRALADAVEAMYDDWFIETCAPEHVAELGDLIGFDRSLLSGAPEIDRALVADSLRVNGRKGTLASLMIVAADVASWPARAREASASLSMTAVTRLPGLAPHSLPDIRRAQEQTTIPVRRSNRLSDVREVNSARTRGRGKPTSVLVDVWRQHIDTVAEGAAFLRGPGCYTFDAVGRDVELATRPAPKRGSTRTVGDVDVPAPIERATLAHHLADYYGPGRSLEVRVDDAPVDIDDIVVGDLSRWHPPDGPRLRRRDRPVCIDPRLGRIALRQPDGACWAADDAAVQVSYSRLRSMELGSGHRRERVTTDPGPDEQAGEVLRVRSRPGGTKGDSHRTIAEAYDAWRAGRENGTAEAGVRIELMDDGPHHGPVHLDLHAGESLVLRAAGTTEPVVAPNPDSDHVTVAVHGHGPGMSTVRLEGVFLWRGLLHVTGSVGHVEVVDCTLAPPRAAARNQRRTASISVECTAAVRVERCLLGPVRVGPSDDEHPGDTDPGTLTVVDSVLDAHDADRRAVFGWRERPANVVLGLNQCTVLGSLSVRAVDSVRNCLVTGSLECAHRQGGTVEHTYLGQPSRTPRRVHCQPDDALLRGAASFPPVAEETVLVRLVPSFDSTDLGHAAYARMTLDAPVELRTGAEDGGELGALHDQWEAARAALLRRHLAALAPAGVDIDVRFAT